jgi:hypothetical protein
MAEKTTQQDPLEPFTVTEDDMMAIVAVCKAIRGYSKNRTIGDLVKELELEEILYVDGNDSQVKKIVWKKPMLDLIKKVEKKFSARLKQYKKLGLI